MGGNGVISSEDMLPRFPLVICDKCNIRRVKHWVSKTEDNFLRHFYKCPNHGAHDGGCNFWKWEDVYETHLLSIGEAQSNGSSSARKVQGRTNQSPKIACVPGGSNEIHRQLMEIVFLLKLVIFGLGILVCLMLLVVWRQ